MATLKNIKWLSVEQSKFVNHLLVHKQHRSFYIDAITSIFKRGYYYLETDTHGVSELDILRLVRLDYIDYLTYAGLKYPSSL